MNCARIVILALPLLLGAIGCKDPKKDMAVQRKYEPYTASEAFLDGTSARPLVAGTIPRDPARVPARAWAASNDTGEVMAVDLAPAGAAVPFPMDRGVLTRGQETFDVYCSVCHGRLGNGTGMIVQRGFPRPPSFHVPRLVAAPDSHFYDVISNGFGAMYGYAQRVPPRRRWEVVAYIRALQVAPGVAGAELSEADRRALIAFGDRPPAVPPSTRPVEGRP
jgi:mono/diheme cytochrome c family protein